MEEEVVTFCLSDDTTLVCSRSTAESNEKIAALLRSGMRGSEPPVRIPICHGRRAVASFVYYLSVGRELVSPLLTTFGQDTWDLYWLADEYLEPKLAQACLVSLDQFCCRPDVTHWALAVRMACSLGRKINEQELAEFYVRSQRMERHCRLKQRIRDLFLEARLELMQACPEIAVRMFALLLAVEAITL